MFRYSLLILALLLSTNFIIAQNEILFEDDFSEDTGLWESADRENYFAGIVDGVYRIELIDGVSWRNTAGYDDWSRALMIEGNYDYELTLRNMQSADGHWCAFMNVATTEAAEQYIDFEICRDGVWRVFDGYEFFLYTGNFDPIIDLTEPGDFRFRLEAREADYMLYINDQLVIEHTTPEPIGGSIGFGIVSRNQQPTNLSAEFDDLVIRRTESAVVETYLPPQDVQATALPDGELVDNREVPFEELPNLLLTDGANLWERIPYNSSRDLYYEGSVGDLITIDTGVRTSGDLRLELIAPDGSIVGVDEPFNREIETSLEDIVLEQNGIYTLRVINQGRRRDDRGTYMLDVEVSARNVQVADTTDFTSEDGTFNPAQLSGQYLQPIEEFIYIDEATNIAFLFDQSLFIERRESDGYLVISSSQEMLDEALSTEGFVDSPQETVLYIWAITPEEIAEVTEDSTDFRTMSELLALALFPQFDIDRSIAPLAARNWRSVSMNDFMVDVRMTTAQPVTGNYLVMVGVEGAEDSIRFAGDILDSITDQGFPYFSNRQRFMLGLPPERQEDAEELVVTRELSQTFTSPAFPVDFDYPAGEEWNAESASTVQPIGGALYDSLGSPAVIVYQPDADTVARVSVFVQTSFLSPGQMLDMMSLSGGSATGNEIVQYYQDDTVFNVVTSEAFGLLARRVDVQLPGSAASLSVIVLGDSTDYIDLETQLAIAASIRPNE